MCYLCEYGDHNDFSATECPVYRMMSGISEPPKDQRNIFDNFGTASTSTGPLSPVYHPFMIDNSETESCTSEDFFRQLHGEDCPSWATAAESHVPSPIIFIRGLIGIGIGVCASIDSFILFFNST